MSRLDCVCVLICLGQYTFFLLDRTSKLADALTYSVYQLFIF